MTSQLIRFGLGPCKLRYHAPPDCEKIRRRVWDCFCRLNYVLNRSSVAKQNLILPCISINGTSVTNSVGGFLFFFGREMHQKLGSCPIARRSSRSNDTSFSHQIWVHSAANHRAFALTINTWYGQLLHLPLKRGSIGVCEGYFVKIGGIPY